MGGPSVQVPGSEGRRLDSWKEIAAYLNRDVTTVQRWEKREGMPVYRHVHDKRGSVYAVQRELEAWLEQRRPEVSGRGMGGEQRDEPHRTVWTPLAGLRGTPVRMTAWWVAVVVVCAGMAGAYVAWRGGERSAPGAQIRSVAVLPLKNLSGDPSQEYLADGVTEAVIGRLAGIRELRVTSRTSVMRFKDSKETVPEIGKALGVDAVVEGSVIREGSRIRVSVQLIRAATDEHLWSETYDREMRDVLTMESELAQEIADRVKVTVTARNNSG